MAFRQVQDIKLDAPAEQSARPQAMQPTFREVTDVELDKPQAVEPQEAGFFERQRQRGAETANLAEAIVPLGGEPKEGGIRKAEAQIRGAGQFAAGVTDVVGEGATALFHAAMTDKGEEKLSAELQQLAATPVGQAGIEAIQKGGELYSEFKEGNPRVAGLLEAGANIIGVLPLLKGLGAAKSVATTAPEGVIAKAPAAVAQAKERATALFTKKSKEALQPDDLKTLSADKYKQAAEAGENFPDAVRLNLINSLESKKAGAESLRKGSNDIDNALELMEVRKGEVLTLDGAQQIDEELGQLISKNYRDGLNADGKKLLEIQDKFRSEIQKSEGGKLLKEGRDLWSASKRMEDIDRILKNAEFTDNPATSIKNGFRTLARNKKRMRGYSPKERKLIEKAAKSGVIPNTLRTIVGSRLISTGLGGILGGTGGAITGAVVSGAARKAAESAGKRATKGIQQEITNRAQSGSLRNAIKESK